MALLNLKETANQIKSQSLVGGNTHTLIGQLFLDLLELVLTTETLSQTSGTDINKVMSQDSVTKLIVALQNSINKINESLIISNSVPGSENVCLKIIAEDDQIGEIGIDAKGIPFFRHISADNIAKTYKLTGTPGADGQVYRFNASTGNFELYNLKDIFMATLKTINAAGFVQSGAYWISPAIQLLLGNAQVQITNASDTVVSVMRSNTGDGTFSDIAGFAETVKSPGDVFNISGGVGGGFIKLKFTVKPTQVTILS